ncbi:MAG TPA: peptidyl-prolyl cis-trans isomerase [Pyrinomonadaceae bacterium]|nr:peptidyl-prolyl cis-trans isomerase [Pyrinomonadaceae bacterium]
MLKQLSRLERTRNLVIIGFAVLMAVSLVFFYAPSRTARSLDPARSTEALAKVGGDEVTVGDLARLRENYQRMFGSQISLAQLGGNKRFLDGLIRDRVVAQEAARLGLAASDAEVAEEIRKRYSDASGKFVGLDRYKESVSANYGGIEQFERQIRDSIAAQKLEAFVTAGVLVSDEEVQDQYKRQNTSFDLVYVTVTADQLAKKIEPSDEELRAHYEAHKEDFRIPEPQKKIRYLYIDQAKAGERLQIPDEELRAEYDKLSPENKQAGVKVQQVILKVARPELDDQVKAKAQGLVTQARGSTGNATEEAFAELAKGNSEDPATAKDGGRVPGVVKKNPNKSDDPYQKVLDLQPGAVTDPIKYKNAYYILRRGEAVPKTFEQARQELLVSLRNRKAYASAAQLAARAADRSRETADFQKVAQELATEANMKPAEMIKETPYVRPGDDVPNIGSSQQFEEAIAPLNNPNDIGEHTPVKGGFAIPMLVDKRDPRIPEFDEVKDKVIQAVRQERAKSQLEQTARDLASSANSADDLKAAAAKLGLEAETADTYKLGSPLGKAGTSTALDEAIYGLNAGEVAKSPVKVSDNWVVVCATKRTEADLAEFAKQRDQLRQTALSARRNQVFEDYISAVKQRMQREGQIKVYDEVLTRFEEDLPPVADAPRRAPQLPISTK